MNSAAHGLEQTFGEVSNGIQHIQGAMASILPSFPGVSAGKILDLAIGLDFEPTVMPPCPVFPVPHCGLVFDPFALIMGAIASAMPAKPTSLLGKIAAAILDFLRPSVQANNLWICNAGTSVYHLPAFLIHLIPLAKPFSSSELWMGSSTVLANGGPFSTQFHPTLSCNLVGSPSLPRKNKPPKLKYPLMLPTSILICIFSGSGKILAGGPPTIDLFALAMHLGLKGLGKATQKGIDKIPSKYSKLADKLQAVQCKVFGEPVDAVTGSVIATNTDFELPGPLPLQWTRYYYSDAEVEGPLGFNWHHHYNMGLYDMDNGYITLRLADGREATFPKVHISEVFYNREEQLFFRQDEKGFFVTDAEKLVYRFEGAKNKDGYAMLSSVTNAAGFSIRFSYNLKGQLKRIIDSCRRILQVENDQLGRITRIYTVLEDREVNFIQYSYDAAGNMVKTLDVIGAEKHFYYEGHLLAQLTNQSGMNFYWEYEGKGDDARCIHTWGDEGVLEYWAEYKDGVTVTRNSLGHTAEYYYHPNRLIYKIVDENGGITRQSWNKFRELEITINPEGGVVKYDYNEYGKLVAVTNENRQNNNYQYDDRQNLKYTSSFGNHSAFYFYDEQNRLTCRRSSEGRAIHYHYEGPYLTQIKDHGGRTVNFTYDEHNNITKATYYNGLEEHWSYDGLGYITRYTDVRGNSTECKNDDAGNVIYLKEADGNEHHFKYDTSYNLVDAKDRFHHVQFEYGPLGVLRKRIQNNRTVQFNYDTELQLRSIANEGGELYKFGLDGMGNVVNEWGFDGLHRRYLRDGNGRVTKVLRPGERWTQYSYDGVGNIVQEEHSDGSMAAYKYNADSLLIEAFNNDSHIRLTRERNGRIVKETQGAYAVTRKYDVDGNCLHIGSNLGADIQMQYDRQNGLTGITAITAPDQGTPGEASWAAAIHRDATGLELHRQLSGNVGVKTERDRLGRVTRRSIGAHNAEQSRTRYDWGMGNKLNRIVNELDKTSTLFEYDAFDNLISGTYENKNGVTETIYRVPDKIGNLFKTRDRSDRKYSKGGRLQEDDKYVYHYDGEGNIIFKEFKSNPNTAAIVHTEYARKHSLDFKRSGTGWIYEWAGNGLLRKVINPGGKEIEFFYDPLGRRIAKIAYDKNARFYEENTGVVTRWVWDGNVPLHEWKYEGTYPPKKSVDEEGIKEEQEPVENTITWLYEANSFVPCAKLIDNEQYSIVTDYLGTPTHAYNGSGEKVWERELDIYGAVKKETGKKGLVPQLYQGQYVDEDTGLAYNRFRYYDNESGNYISQDPIGLGGGNKFYAYVHDVNSWTDSLGLDPIKNKVDGDAREKIAREQLQKEHPNAKIVKERYLRDANGKSVKDSLTGERRRIDLVVIEDGKVTKVVEVTSHTADKTAQREKEMRIRNEGGTYIREPGKRGKNGLHDISGIETERMNIDLEGHHHH
ncbi:hypothetical protein A8C56_12945 [Niabella ginsenosidivorans]|uniref:Type IV secretion protein Rhs n=2 Tax=Niabella ginsenosidivorans TaxID=1176587 RepID=A0A1A9I277_9BACT|nr:hypothetical protein A8C56_12945 [Niabella ginsenosidivorans]